MGGVILYNRVYLSGSSNGTVSYQVCFGSGSTNRVCFAMFLSAASYPFWFSFERRKDANIADAERAQCAADQTGAVVAALFSPAALARDAILVYQFVCEGEQEAELRRRHRAPHGIGIVGEQDARGRQRRDVARVVARAEARKQLEA